MTLEEAFKDQYILDYCKYKGIQVKDIGCLDCLDGDQYPHYGKAPHKSFIEVGIMDFSEGHYLSKEKYPDNFVLDPECKENESFPCGTYYCPNTECKNSKDNFSLF